MSFLKGNRFTYIKNILLPCLLFSTVAGGVTGILLFLFKTVASRVIALSDTLYGFVRQQSVYLPLLLLGAGVLGLVAALLLWKAPNCRGGGIPTSVAILRGLIPFSWIRSIFLLFTSALLSFLCGLPLGSEGPGVQMGTAVGRGTVELFGKKNKAWDRYIMTGGACAGFAAATGAPLSGIFFAFEEAHRRFSPMIFMTASTAVLSGTAVSRLLCDLTNTEFALFSLDITSELSLSHVWTALPIGLVTGLSALLFTLLYRRVGDFVNKTLKKIPFAVKLTVAFMLTALFGFFFADLLGSGHSLIHTLLHQGGLWYLLLLCFCLRAILMMLSNHIGATGGLFLPTLTFGAILGSLLGSLMVSLHLLPPDGYPVAVVIGMLSFLGAASRTPITAVLFGVEVFCGLFNLLPLAVGVTVAYLVIETAGVPSFNESVIESKVEKAHEGKIATVVDARLTVMPGSFAVGKEVRDILWPPTCVVLSVHKANPGTGSFLAGGDVLQVHYQTHDPSETAALLETLVGQQEKPAETARCVGNVDTVPDL